MCLVGGLVKGKGNVSPSMRTLPFCSLVHEVTGVLVFRRTARVVKPTRKSSRLEVGDDLQVLWKLKNTHENEYYDAKF
jgi:hypothetical protein